MLCTAYCAGVPGLEPRLTEPESAGLPITPYPTERLRLAAQGGSLPQKLECESLRNAG